MKVPQRAGRHELAIGHLRDQLGRAVRVRLTPNHNLGHLRQFLDKELARIPMLISFGQNVLTAKQQFVMINDKERNRMALHLYSR